MTTALEFGAALLAGLLLGLVFYGGLWWTVQRVSSARRPALLLTASCAARMTLLLTGLLALSWGSLLRLGGGLLGVQLARLLTVSGSGRNVGAGRGDGVELAPAPGAPEETGTDNEPESR